MITGCQFVLTEIDVLILTVVQPLAVVLDTGRGGPATTMAV